MGENTVLRLLHEGLEIDPTNGSETLYEASDLFEGGIDCDLEHLGLNERSHPTQKAKVDVHELISDATFAKIFRSLSNNLNSLCLTQAQIKKFVEKRHDYLRGEGCATFFLFRNGKKLFVAYVRLDSEGRLHIYVSRFKYSYVWRAEDRHRVVVPQLIKRLDS